MCGFLIGAKCLCLGTSDADSLADGCTGNRGSTDSDTDTSHTRFGDEDTSSQPHHAGTDGHSDGHTGCGSGLEYYSAGSRK